MDGKIKIGDITSFRLFALKVRALIGMLDQLGAKGWTELKCGSHVSRLLAKLPHDLRANFRWFIKPIQIPVPTLLDLSDWLKYELRIQEDESLLILVFRSEPTLSHRQTSKGTQNQFNNWLLSYTVVNTVNQQEMQKSRRRNQKGTAPFATPFSITSTSVLMSNC